MHTRCDADIVLVDRRQAHLWRSDSLRSLLPEKRDSSEAGGKLRDHTLSEVREHCIRAARVFDELEVIKLLIQPLEKPLRDTFCDSLVILFEEAGALAMRLWTQRTGIECHFGPQLAKEQFTVNSPIMQAHPLHKLDDPDDHCLDGRPVKLTLHPAVLRLGTHDAENYDERRVWAKAVVWLDV